MADDSNKQLEILLVEDTRWHADLIREVLEKLGSVTWAPSQRAAQQAVEEQEFDVFVLDQHLPDGSGTEFLEWFRARSDRHPPAIFVTSDDEAAAQLFEAEGVACLHKSRGYLSRLIPSIREVVGSAE